MKYLVTSALPYANGPLHFGHLAGVYIPADIFCRHKKMQGQEVLHICGSDEHGVAIMQNAEKAKRSYQEYVNEWHKKHLKTLGSYGVDFSYFGQTSADYHAEETLKWFEALHSKGFIESQVEDQLQCQDCHNYLPDRYVQGECYNCGYEKARGDECPSCGEWIDATKLKNPVCQFCESTNIKVVPVTQWYLMLSKYHKEFRQWLATKEKSWPKHVYSYVNSLTEEGMVDRAITRDLKWGIDVPLDEAKGKKLYVWFDAPIGYVSNTKEKVGDEYLTSWWQNPDVERVNFIGKDNIIFHAVIFPVMSMASERVKPVDYLAAHQYVNLEGKAFSKSEGHYVDADEAMEKFGENNLRYYLTQLIPESADTSFTWEGFEAKINGELANNIGNFINRSLSFTYKNFKDGIATSKIDAFLASDTSIELKTLIKEVHQALDGHHFRKAQDLVMKVGMLANGYFSDRAPWAQIKEDEEACAETLAVSMFLSYVLAALFNPFLPNLSTQIRELLGEISDADLGELYRGNMEVIKSKEVLQVVKKPKGLIKKVEL